jgi:hypothetical protein
VEGGKTASEAITSAVNQPSYSTIVLVFKARHTDPEGFSFWQGFTSGSGLVNGEQRSSGCTDPCSDRDHWA